MAYVELTNFKYGLDSRRSVLTEPPGALSVLRNAYINQGGEIEKRRAFFPMMDYYFIGSGTEGLNAESRGLVVFDSVTTPTLAGNNPLIAKQVMLTTQYMAASYTTTLASATVTFGNSGQTITITDGKTSAAGTITIGGTASAPTVLVGGTWAVGDIFKITLTIGVTDTIVQFPISAMPADSVTTAGLAIQIKNGLIARNVRAGNTDVITVSGSVVTLAGGGGSNLTVSTAGSVTTAGTAVVAGNGTPTVTVTIGGTWLSGEVISIAVDTVGTDYEYLALVQYTTRGFTARAMTGGSGTTPPITYQRLIGPTFGTGTVTLSEVIESCTYGDKSFVIATFGDGGQNTYTWLYYDGNVIPDSYVGYVYPFMVGGSTIANIVNQFKYSYGTDYQGFNIDFNASTSTRIVVSSYVGSPTVTFTYSSANGKISSNGTLTGTWAAGDTITITATLNNVTTVWGYGSVTAKSPTHCFSFRNKVYLCDNTSSLGAFTRFCAIGNATFWNDTGNEVIFGAGFINLTQQDSVGDTLICGANYQGRIAFFFRHSVQIWILYDDTSQNILQQILSYHGTVARLGTIPVGGWDVLFVSDSGIRSLRVKDQSLNAYIGDIGSPIDNDIRPLVVGYIANPYNYSDLCCGYDPMSGLYMIQFDTTANNNPSIWALAYYPESKVAAWCNFDAIYFDGAGTQRALLPTKFVTWNGALYFRATAAISVGTNDAIVVYDPTAIGRTTYANGYDITSATVETPWLSLKEPGTEKVGRSVDAAQAGLWTLKAGMDPRGATLDTVSAIGSSSSPDVTDDSTFDILSFPVQMSGTHLKLQAVSAIAKRAVLSSLVFHYNKANEKT